MHRVQLLYNIHEMPKADILLYIYSSIHTRFPLFSNSLSYAQPVSWPSRFWASYIAYNIYICSLINRQRNILVGVANCFVLGCQSKFTECYCYQIFLAGLLWQTKVLGQRRKHSAQSNTKVFKTVGFRFLLAKTRFSVEKHEDESGAWQQRLN